MATNYMPPPSDQANKELCELLEELELLQLGAQISDCTFLLRDGKLKELATRFMESAKKRSVRLSLRTVAMKALLCHNCRRTSILPVLEDALAAMYLGAVRIVCTAGQRTGFSP